MIDDESLKIKDVKSRRGLAETVIQSHPGLARSSHPFQKCIHQKYSTTMDDLLECLECDLQGRKSIQDCLRLTRRPSATYPATDRTVLKTVKAAVSSRRIGGLHSDGTASFLDCLKHIIVTIRFIQYMLEYSELQEPESQGEEPKKVVLSIIASPSSEQDIVLAVQSTIKSIVGVICYRLEQSGATNEESWDADELFEMSLDQEDVSLHCQNVQMAYLLQGSLSQVLQTYTSERPWLAPTILKPYSTELLPAIQYELPTPLRHQMVRFLCGVLDEAVGSSGSAPTRLLQYMFKQLDTFANADTADLHLPTVLSLLGSLGLDDPLRNDLHSFLTEAVIRVDSDTPFFAIGKLRALLRLLKTPAYHDCVEEILLRTLPAAIFTKALTVPQKIFMIDQALEAVAEMKVPDSFLLMCLGKANHPLSIEVCSHLLAATSSRLVLAAKLVSDKRTNTVLRRRLVSLLMRVGSDREEIANALKAKVKSLYRCKNALALVLPLLGHFNIALDPPYSRLLTGPFLKNPSSKLEQCSALQKAYDLCTKVKQCDFNQLLDCVLLPCSRSDDEEVLAGVFRVVTVAAPFATERFPEIFQSLFTKRHLHAQTVSLLLNISSTIPKHLRSHLQQCTANNKEIRQRIKERLADKLYNPQNLDVESLRAKVAHELLENLPSRSAIRSLFVSQGSLILQMPTQEGRSAMVVFPPGDDSRRDIEFMLRGAAVDIVQLENMSVSPGGFQLHMNPASKILNDP